MCGCSMARAFKSGLMGLNMMAIGMRLRCRDMAGSCMLIKIYMRVNLCLIKQMGWVFTDKSQGKFMKVIG